MSVAPATATLSQFNQFEVPLELVAQRPAVPRDAARLMVLRRGTGTISHHIFRELPDLLDDSYTLVVNNSRVVNCKLDVQADAGLAQAIYLLEQTGPERWSVSGDALATLPEGAELRLDGSSVIGRLDAHDEDGTAVVSFRGADVAAELRRIAQVPLPPYITDVSAADRYQTVYAKEDGSVAAPTAGLHFTAEVFARLAAKGVEKAEITLHVGYGTFAHVEQEELSRHRMHSERYRLDAATASRLTAARAAGRKILTTGTTATRTLETCAQPDGSFAAGEGDTSIFISPPYDFKAVDALLTNFHMPGLTPIMLVAAFAGRELTLEAYDVAIRERYRFFSFGDAMLVL